MSAVDLIPDSQTPPATGKSRLVAVIPAVRP